MLIKTAPVLLKAPGNGGDGMADGTFEAIVSVFGNKDSYGDVVVPGAFKDTLAEWKDSGLVIPIYYSHRMDDPDFNIGGVQDAKEVKEDELGFKHPAGLWVKGLLDLDGDASRVAKQSYRLMKGGRLAQFSFAYDVMEGGFVEKKTEDGQDSSYFELRKLKLYEVGPTPIGANQETELLGIKAFAGSLIGGLKAGRVLSSKNETSLREARDAIDAVLASLGDEEDGKASATQQEKQAQQQPAGKDEEPETAKSEDPPADLRAVDSILASLSIKERQ